MWPVSDDFRTALGGSYELEVRASVSLGGETLAESLPITAGARLVSELAESSVRQTLTLPISDDHGELLGMSMSSPLAPFGQRITATAYLRVSGMLVESVPLGVLRIDDPGSDGEEWAYYEATRDVAAGGYTYGEAALTYDAPVFYDGGGLPQRTVVGGMWVPQGRSYSVRASDLLEMVADDDFLDDFSPTGSLITASVRVLDGLLPMGAWTGAGSSPTGLTYSSDRVAALAGLAALDGRVPAVDRDGSYLPRPSAVKAVPDWTITARVDLASVRLSLASAGIHSAVMVTGEDADQRPTRGVATITTGPLRWGGPFGKRTTKATNPLARTDALAQSIAEGQLAHELARLTIPVSVKAAPNPAMDVLDTVCVVLPDRTLTGLATRIDLPLDGADMDVTVAVPWQEVW